MFAPVYAASGNAVLAANAVAWVSYLLAAFAMERLLRSLRLSAPAAWASGLLFALGPLGVPASLQVPQLLRLYLPLVALALLRLRERPSAGRGATFAACLALAVFSSYYLAALAAVVALVWIVVELSRRGGGRARFLQPRSARAQSSQLSCCGFPDPTSIAPSPRPCGAMKHCRPQPPRRRSPPTISLRCRGRSCAPFSGLSEAPIAPALAALGLFGFGFRGLRRISFAGLAFVVVGAGSLLWLIAAGGMSPGVAELLGFFRHAYRSQVLTGFGVALLAAAALEACRRLLDLPVAWSLRPRPSPS